MCGLNPKALAFEKKARRGTRSAASDAPVAVIGETGTGKEVLAHIRDANSPRAHRGCDRQFAR